MRLLVDLTTNFTTTPQDPLITQVEKTPDPNVAVPLNGRYVLPIVTSVEFPIDSDSYVLDAAGDIDGSDVSSISFSYLLAMFPEFDDIYFNPLLTDDHVGELDPTSTAYNSLGQRFQTGRAPGGPDTAGQMPTHTALLAQNNTVAPARPGLMVTDNIDISALVPAGTPDFMVYWKLLNFTVSEDIRAAYGALNGQNSPAIRSVYEIDQEPSGFSVYISPDNGATWTLVNLLEPVTIAVTTTFRLAFVNTSNAKVFLASFAVMF